MKIDAATDEDNLLLALAGLAKKGPIVPVSKGSNAVGKTMQDALGIQHMTAKRNSLFNYTVTATAARSSSSARTNLFACVPNWKSSTYKSSKELVEKFGREDLAKGYEKSLFCTTTSQAPNGFGLVLSVDPRERLLDEQFDFEGSRSPVASWDVDKLEAKLASLGKTAIVTALSVEVGNKAAFQYRYVDLLGRPDTGAFLEMLQDGSITIDHCISMKVGSEVAREQGPLFKIRADSRSELYSDVKRIDLLDL